MTGATRRNHNHPSRRRRSTYTDRSKHPLDITTCFHFTHYTQPPLLAHTAHISHTSYDSIKKKKEPRRECDLTVWPVPNLLVHRMILANKKPGTPLDCALTFWPLPTLLIHRIYDSRKQIRKQFGVCPHLLSVTVAQSVGDHEGAARLDVVPHEAIQPPKLAIANLTSSLVTLSLQLRDYHFYCVS